MLRLLIPSTWPLESAACAWALLDDGGRLLQSGFSDPRTWPAAESCELILTADQCICLGAEVPAKARKLKDDIVVVALEDQLLGDIGEEHWVVGRADGEGKIPVWLVQRQRVADILSTLRQLGRKAVRMVWEAQLPALEAGKWSVTVFADRGVVRTDSNGGWAFDVRDDTLPVELSLALAAVAARPSGLSVYTAGQQGVDVARWQTVLGLPCEQGEPWDWRTVSLTRACNFLSGAFAVQDSKQSLRAFRPALWVAAITLAVYTLVLCGEWVWLSQHARRVQSDILASYQQSFPDSHAILDPYAQMQMDSGRLANTRGALGSNDFLSLLGAASEDIGQGAGAASRLKYENRQLRVEFPVTPKDADGIVGRLQQRGLSARLIAGEGGSVVLIIGGIQ